MLVADMHNVRRRFKFVAAAPFDRPGIAHEPDGVALLIVASTICIA